MKQMSAEEFISALKTQQEITDAQITQDLYLTTNIIPIPIYQTNLIKNIIFSGRVKFDNLNNHTRIIIFENCIFENDTFFVDIDDSNDVLKMILFKECDFKKITMKNNILSNTEIKFNGIDKLNNVIESLYISNNNTIRSISIFSMVAKDIHLYDSTLDYFSISNTMNEFSNIFDNVFNKNFWIQNIISDKIFHLSNNSFKEDIIISDLLDSSYRKENVFNRLLIQNTDFKSISFNSNLTKIKSLEIYFSPKLSGTIYFENYIIDKIEFFQENTKASLIFNKGFFKELFFLNFSNYGNIAFSSCKAVEGTESTFSIENSNLGKAQFYDFDFDSFSKIHIKNTVLTEIVTANVTWFSPKKLNQTNKKDEAYYKNQREVYRQLKQSTDKQGDRIQSLDFQAEEMRVYKEQLKLHKSEIKLNSRLFLSFLFGLLKSIFFIGKGFGKFMNNDKFILWLSQTNDFGLSWKKPAWLLFRITIWFHIFLVFAGKLYFDDFDFSMKGVGYFLSQISYANSEGFFQLFNPTRSLKELFLGINLNPFVYFLDISHRLLYAFFVFQIASGFRKYVK